MAWADNGSFGDFKCDRSKGQGSNSSTAYRNTNGRNGSGLQNRSYSSTLPAAGLNDGSLTKIADLSVGMPATIIVGVVIAKEDARHIPNRKNPTTERCVMSFSVRDSPNDFINVTAWGDEQFINDLATQFRISDVVEICQAGIQSKPTDGSDERYRPSNASMLQLNIGEKRGTLRMYNGADLSEYNQLSHIPAKASNDFYTIDDILTNGDSLHNELVSLLVMVKKVCPYKDIVTKDGRNIKRCEVRVFDETASNFEIVLWSEELIFFSQTWDPKDHVLFIADLKITRSDFKKTMIGTAVSKTIFTVNPDTKEAYALYQYGQTVEFDDENEGDSPDKSVDLDAIKEVYTIEQVKEKTASREDGQGVLYAISYAFISTLNVDSENPLTVVAIRCNQCHFRVDRETRTCTNPNCHPSSIPSTGASGLETHTMFDMRVACSDHTGTISGCYLSGEVAEKLLGCTMTQPSFDRTTPFVRIVSCRLADPEEALSSMQ